LEREFKSDHPQLSDRELYVEVIALANARGGVLLVGVEDDGTVTGVQARRGHPVDPARLQAAIFNNTVPHLETSARLVEFPGGAVLALEVPRCGEICATSGGKVLRRTLNAHGQPQTVPYYPHEQFSRRADFGLLDYSAQAVPGATFASLDPLEFERLRRTIGRLNGDAKLLDLGDEALAQALRLVESTKNGLVPDVAGLLLLGREEALRQLLPTHQIFFQVLDERGGVRVNEEFRQPLLRVLEEIETRFSARNEEREVTLGLFRLPLPDYSPEGFRESVNNAILHRDYTRLQAGHVQWQPDHLLLTSPGGFPEGITLDNFLVHEPKPRNPRLAEAFRRIGLVEQTGRGIDRIYLGQLRYGRPAPDYTRSDETGVRVVLRGGDPSLQFAAFVYEQDRQGTPLTLDELMVLNELHFERRMDMNASSKLLQKGAAETRSVLERLHERGLIEARGEGRGRAYHLSRGLYQRFTGAAAYVRARGFDRVQQRQMVLNAIEASPQRRITRGEVAELCRLSLPQAYHLLHRMRTDGDLVPVGKGRASYYSRPEGAR
jgi:ATP-dependent DNA helicase RecG